MPPWQRLLLAVVIVVMLVLAVRVIVGAAG